MRDALAAAQLWAGVRPTALMSTGVPTTGDWSEADRLLAVAWSLDKAAMCPGGCGHYLDETLESSGEHSIKHEICGACEARDLDRDERKSEPSVPGELTVVVKDD